MSDPVWSLPVARSAFAMVLFAAMGACHRPVPAATADHDCPAGQEWRDVIVDELPERGCASRGPNGQFLKQGVWMIFYKSGKPRNRTGYKDNRMEGPAIAWYETGEKFWEAVYKDDFVEGTRTAWYPNGQKKEEATAFNRKLQGPETSWYPNGQKKEELSWVDGKKEGVETRWYENGKKSVEIHRHAGLYEGTFTTWKDDGTLEHVSNYHEDKLLS